MADNLKKLIVLNTLANYGLSITRFFTQIILTRILFLNLGQVSYGFWALLWSVFGYSLLLDFGFGTSVQKYTAEASVTGDYKHYNHKLSTVITTYGFMSLIIIIASLGLSQVLDKLFIFPAGTDIVYYKKVFIFFGLGSALTFPSGAFTEILRGLNRIYLRNLVNFTTMILNFIGIIVIFKLGYGLLELAVFSVLINLTSNIIMAIFCFHLLPGMRISPLLFKFSMLKEVISFSLFAYLIMFANIIIFKTDQIVLGIMLGVTAVTIYQVASRFANLLMQFTTQFQENLTPIAASLFKDGQVERLRHIMFNSNRIIAVITTLLFIILTTLIRPILLLWLEISPDDPQYAESYPSIIAIVYLLNISMFLLLLFRSGSSKVLLMTGFHKFLSFVAIFESVMNVGFSILFIKLIGVVGVAVGTLIPNVVLGLFFIFPKAAQFTRITVLETIRRIYLPLAFVTLPALIFLSFINLNIPLQSWTIITLIWVSAVTALLYFTAAWFFMVNAAERTSIKNVIKTKLKIK
ncbi:MAG: oligosaccharide flippase family protein [Candidatus Cloacimonetes bacterium]|nr:oligosaccharide flippase family protein [Candidatus Cloacimonadota bacterium]